MQCQPCPNYKGSQGKGEGADSHNSFTAILIERGVV